jgi:hypothetical protein
MSLKTTCLTTEIVVNNKIDCLQVLTKLYFLVLRNMQILMSSYFIVSLISKVHSKNIWTVKIKCTKVKMESSKRTRVVLLAQEKRTIRNYYKEQTKK